MNIDLINLVKLQKVDARLIHFQKIEEETPQKLAQVEAELQAAEDKFLQSQTLEVELHKRRRNLEADIKDTDEKIKTNQVRQLRAKNNEEYRAMLKEAEFLRKSNSEREDEVLRILEEIEKVSAENKLLKVWVEEQRAEAARKTKVIQENLTRCRTDRQVLDDERDGLIQALPANILSMYQRLRPQQVGRAVVPIVEGICQQCHLMIPPQNFNLLQRNDAVMTCPNCERIIYWQDHEDYKDL